MKRSICLLLSLLLLALCGCQSHPQEETQPTYPPFDVAYTPVGQEPEDPAQRLAWRRDVAEQEMRRMMTIPWTSTVDFSYCYKPTSTGPETDPVMYPDYVIPIEAGKVYLGLPYTHGCGSGDAMISYAVAQDETGVYILDGLRWEHFSGEAKNSQVKCARLGNNCADSVFWAWATVASSISFKDTTTMTEDFGCIPVGEYTTAKVRYSDHTEKLCMENGEQVMFAAYAQLQKADGLVYVNGLDTGHAIMCVSVHVEKDDQGQIDGSKSYVTILDQTSGFEKKQDPVYSEELGMEVYPMEGVDKQKTFNELYTTGYLPVTCKELIDAEPLAKAEVEDSSKDLTAETLFTGEIKANYRIAFVTAQILDESGKELQKAICYGKEEEMYRFDLSRFTDKIEQIVMQGSVDPAALPAGTYRVVMSCHLSTGDDVVFRDLQITV